MISRSALGRALLAELGRRVFSRRLPIGLAAVAVGALTIRPHHLFGAYQRTGTTACVMLVVLGLALRAWAAGSAGQHTRKSTIEAPRLATGGPYAFVRNPIYLGSLILGFGMVGVLGDPWMLVLYLGAFAFLYSSIIPAEEEFLREAFSREYQRYCENVPRLIPRLTRWREARQVSFDWASVTGDLRLGLLLVAIYLLLRGAASLRGF